MKAAGVAAFEVRTDGCELRVDLALDGTQQPLYGPLLSLIQLMLLSSSCSPVELLAPVDPEPAPEPGPEDDPYAQPEGGGPAAKYHKVPGDYLPDAPTATQYDPEAEAAARAELEPASEPVTYTVDSAEPEPDPEPTPEPEPEPVAPSGVAGEILELLRDAGGEISDSAGRVSPKIAELAHASTMVVSSALGRLKAQGLVVSVTTANHRTTSVTLTTAGWKAAGRTEPVAVPAESGSAARQRRAREGAADALYGTFAGGSR